MPSLPVSRQRTVQIKLLFYVTEGHPVYMRTKTHKSDFLKCFVDRATWYNSWNNQIDA